MYLQIVQTHDIHHKMESHFISSMITTSNNVTRIAETKPHILLVSFSPSSKVKSTKTGQHQIMSLE
uniref:Uncharacterized protein n=1 Tax=Arundo donax TaxID=35708 RepID=A0A0A9EDE6_ARUDO